MPDSLERSSTAERMDRFSNRLSVWAAIAWVGFVLLTLKSVAKPGANWALLAVAAVLITPFLISLMVRVLVFDSRIGCWLGRTGNKTPARMQVARLAAMGWIGIGSTLLIAVYAQPWYPVYFSVGALITGMSALTLTVDIATLKRYLKVSWPVATGIAATDLAIMLLVALWLVAGKGST